MWKRSQEREAKARDNAKDSGMIGQICPWKIGIQMFYSCEINHRKSMNLHKTTEWEKTLESLFLAEPCSP